jgi:hypothetical protein
MNKPRTTTFRPGDDVSFAAPAGMLYGTVKRLLGEGDAAAVEIEFEGGRREVKKVRDRSLSLLRRASGASEEEERHSGRERLTDPDIERIRRGEERKRY